MATYKVLQDIEAEDKLVGPLTLRQFIYAAIAAINAFIAFKLATISLILIAPFVPVVILFGVLAAPFGHDQPSEVWLLARIKFILKPHKRIWNQSGIVNLVTITAPKKAQDNLTKHLTQTEVRSRLRALSNTIDSHGWAIKNVNVNLSDTSNYTQIPYTSDRLIDLTTLPQDVPSYDVTAADDMLDPVSNPTAQHLDQMITTADKKYHQQIIEKLNNSEKVQPTISENADYWFMNDDIVDEPKIPEGYAKFDGDKVINPGEDPSNYSPSSQPDEDAALLSEIERNKIKSHQYSKHMRTIEPLDGSTKNYQQVRSNQPKLKPNNPPATTTDPAIISLALANTDNWSVATVSHMADEAKKQEPPQDEVVISLH